MRGPKSFGYLICFVSIALLFCLAVIGIWPPGDPERSEKFRGHESIDSPLLFASETAGGKGTGNRSESSNIPSSAPNIVNRPIEFGDERKRLTLDYIHKHYDPTAESIEITPKMIVLHWTAICSLEGSWNTFNRVHISANRVYIAKYGDVNVSVHFLVDRDGTIYRLMPETTMARHAIGLNWCAIGVENVGSNRICTLTEAQVESNAALVRYLAGKYDTIEYLIGHYEYGAFRGAPLWKALIPDYFTHKIDPGESFMAGVRGRLTDLDLKSSWEGNKYQIERSHLF